VRSFVGFNCIASFGILLAAACGDAESSAPAECVENICPCSEGGIRAAIVEGGGPYSFDCDGPTTVVSRAEIVIDRDVTLDGGGNLTLDGNGRHRVFSVLEGTVVELVEFVVTNGREADENGGGLRNEGTLTLTNSTVSGSSAGDDGGCRTDDINMLCVEGGGIWNSGTLTLMGSTVSGNSAPFGGGIANRGGILTLVDSAVLSNSAQGCRGVGAVVCSGGGGIWNSGVLTMQGSSVSGSSADWGAGIYNRGNPTLINTNVFGNSAGFDGGGLLNFETLNLVDSTVADNEAGQSGGGIANEAGSLEVTSSTLSGNTAASAGGGIFNPSGAGADLVNTTVSANSADTGGAIYSGGELQVSSSTMAGNDAPTASAIYDPGTSNALLRLISNTLVVGDCAGAPFDSGGHNIESPGNTCGFDEESDQPGAAQTNLGPLADNGGPTMTHALLEGSVAVDQIPAAACLDRAGEPLTVDQRGEPRPAGASDACDIGAFEAQ
jgi:predicted outer membrane repeat protein